MNKSNLACEYLRKLSEASELPHVYDANRSECRKYVASGVYNVIDIFGNVAHLNFEVHFYTNNSAFCGCELVYEDMDGCYYSDRPALLYNELLHSNYIFTSVLYIPENWR
mgnify:CR=1 FL=1